MHGKALALTLTLTLTLNKVHGKASREYDPTELKAYLVELTSVLGGTLALTLTLTLAPSP